MSRALKAESHEVGRPVLRPTCSSHEAELFDVPGYLLHQLTSNNSFWPEPHWVSASLPVASETTLPWGRSPNFAHGDQAISQQLPVTDSSRSAA